MPAPQVKSTSFPKLNGPGGGTSAGIIIGKHIAVGDTVSVMWTGGLTWPGRIVSVVVPSPTNQPVHLAWHVTLDEPIITVKGEVPKKQGRPEAIQTVSVTVTNNVNGPSNTTADTEVEVP